MLDAEGLRARTQLAVETQRVGFGQQWNNVLIVRYLPEKRQQQQPISKESSLVLGF